MFLDFLNKTDNGLKPNGTDIGIIINGEEVGWNVVGLTKVCMLGLIILYICCILAYHAWRRRQQDLRNNHQDAIEL